MEEQAGLWRLPSQRSMDSSSSTPYESAVCSPRRSSEREKCSYYSVSAAPHPVTITCDIRSLPATSMSLVIPSLDQEEPSSEDFDFSARFSETDPSWSPTLMSSADELFCNGQIRPLWYNCGDFMHLPSDYANKVVNGDDDDDDNHFDFRSSADYKFSMFSASHSPDSALTKVQKYVEYGYDGYSHAQVSQGVKEDSGEAQIAKQIMQKWRAYSRQGQEEVIAKQDIMVKVDETRGRRIGGFREGGIRRARSLSPLRVFHMDDELPRQSFETDKSCYSEGGHGVDERGEEQGTQVATSKGRRMTLKELLHSGSRRVERNPSQKQQQSKAHMEMEMEMKMKMKVKMKERRAHWFRSSPKQALVDNKVKESNHASRQLPGHHQASMSPSGVYYASQRVHMEHVRPHTFLPYRSGLFGCLGFTSKNYRSVASMRTFHSKREDTR